MASRINRAIELLAQDQAIYYVGNHSGHVLTAAQGREDAATWADYINIGMEHGAFDMTGLAAYLEGMAAAGPTRSGHRTPTVIVEAPVDGVSAVHVRINAWQFRQILGRGVHGVLLCQAESAGAVRAFVESCRYPHHPEDVDRSLPTPVERMNGAHVIRYQATPLGVGTRGRGSESTAAPIWGISEPEYREKCDPWPLNPNGELLLGVKLESPEGIAHCDEILAVPGLGFAELGPGDLSLALGYREMPRGVDNYPPEMKEARQRVLGACRKRGIAFLETCTPETVAARIDEGVRVVAGHREDTARAGRAHQKRGMPV
ncbi:MAG TPA: aldolase/citrate lyase family protein [Stellaceae bacterium]|nr:aldolase/citrate lyase family protein [Stellaceae bacterium]